MEYPLFKHNDKCDNARYVGGVSKYLCECEQPTECAGVKAVALDEALADITLTAKRIPERKDTDFKDAIHWELTLTKGGYSCKVEYSEGVGIFINNFSKLGKQLQNYLLNDITGNLRGGMTHYGISHSEIRNYITDRVKVTKENIMMCKYKITPPALKDVVYSLVSDSDAVNYSFDDWCDNFGYSTDSRKALKTWHACTDNYRKLKALGLNVDRLN